MQLSSYRRLALALAVTGLAFSAVIAADENQPAPPRAGQNRPPNPPGQPAQRLRNPQVATNFDGHFAACLLLSTDNEIAAARLATQRSENPEVRKFAQELENDHQQFAQNLERFGKDELAAVGGKIADNGANRREPATRAGNAAQPARQPDGADVALQPVAATPSGDTGRMFLQIKRELADACRASVQRELDSKKGAEFDACFIGLQIGAHLWMVDELKVLERHASPELRPVLMQGRETAQRHFEEAKQIMKRLDDRQTASK